MGQGVDFAAILTHTDISSREHPMTLVCASDLKTRQMVWVKNSTATGVPAAAPSHVWADLGRRGMIWSRGEKSPSPHKIFLQCLKFFGSTIFRCLHWQKKIIKNQNTKIMKILIGTMIQTASCPAIIIDHDWITACCIRCRSNDHGTEWNHNKLSQRR